MRYRLTLLPVVLIVLLAGCGGGDAVLQNNDDDDDDNSGGVTPPSSALKITLEEQLGHRSGAVLVAPLGVIWTSYSNASWNDVPFQHNGCQSTPCDQDLVSIWDYGDTADSGFWLEGAFAGRMPRNGDANINIGGHVYKTPGSYTPRVKAHYQGEWASSTGPTYNVLDPDIVYAGETTCFATDDSNWSGCPSGAKRIVKTEFTSDDIVLGERVLLRRGDQFEVSARLQPPAGLDTENEPWYVAGFGTGNNPVLFHSHDGNGWFLGNSTGCRIVGVDSQAATPSPNTKAYEFGGASDAIKSTECHIVDTHSSGFLGWVSAHSQFDREDAALHDGLTFVDNSFTQGTPCNSCVGGPNLFFILMPHLLAAGNHFGNNIEGEHIWRSQYSAVAYEAHNSLGNPAKNKSQRTIRGANWSTGCGGNGIRDDDNTAFGIPVDGVSDCGARPLTPDGHHVAFAFNRLERTDTTEFLNVTITSQNSSSNENSGMHQIVGNEIVSSAPCLNSSCRVAFSISACTDCLLKYNYFDQKMTADFNNQYLLIGFSEPDQEAPETRGTRVIGNTLVSLEDTTIRRINSIAQVYGDPLATFPVVAAVTNTFFAPDDNLTDKDFDPWGGEVAPIDIDNRLFLKSPFSVGEPSTSDPFGQLRQGSSIQGRNQCSFDWSNYVTLDGLCRPPNEPIDCGPFDADAVACP